MKKGLFRKAMAVISALAVSAQMLAGLSVAVSAETVVYSQDFEGDTSGDWTIGGNTTSGILENAKDNGTRVYRLYTSGAGGNRESSMTLSSGGLGAGVGIDISFKLRGVGSNTNGSEFRLTDKDKTSILNFTFNSYMTNPAINGKSVVLDSAKGSGISVSDYATSGWLQFDARVDFRKTPATVDLKVTDLTYGNKIVYEGITQTTAANVSKMIFNIGRSNGGFAVDDIVVKTLTDAEMGDVVTYYTVRYNVDGIETVESVESGKCAANIPQNTAKTGYIFDGWAKDGDTSVLYTSDEVAAMVISADTTFTAKYSVDENYIEALAAVSLVMPNGDFAVMSDSADVFAENKISLKLTGENGGDISANPDPRVDDFNVNWEFLGYDVLNGEPTGDLPTGIEGEYVLCDSYAHITGATSNSTEVNFGMANTPANYYGFVRATVTYNGKTLIAQSPFVILGDKSQSGDIIIPRAGYTSDFDMYSDGVVGYKAYISPDNRSGDDSVLGGWWTGGGNLGRTVELVKENDNKYLSLHTDGTNSSNYAVFKTATQTTQVIIDQMVRFHNNNSSILYKSANPVTWNDSATSMAIAYNGGTMDINGAKIADGLSTNVWYRIVASVDASSKTCFAIVYDENGNELGRSDKAAFVNAGSVTPQFYCYRTPDNSTGRLDFDNVKMTVAAVDAASMQIKAQETTIAIPQAEGEAAAETTIAVEALTTAGYDATAPAEWSISDESITNVTITPDSADSRNAVIKVAYGAPAGDLPVKVTVGGVSSEITLRLTGTQDSVNFTKAPVSVSIPLNAGEEAKYVYAAEVRDGSGTVLADKTVEYALYDKNNISEAEGIEGVSFDKATATLTVTAAAKPQVLTVRATALNSENEVISRAVKVTIHGLAFDLGAGADEDIADGYTAISPSTGYTDAAGYGIEGTAVAGGDASITDADSDYLEGSFIFKAKVDKGAVYNVSIHYSGDLAWERVNSDLTGVAKSNSVMSTVTYEIPVIDGVLDLNFTNAKVASISIEKQAAKSAAAKPAWYAVGDSTIANNGSWAYVLNRDIAQYTVLADVVDFENRGRGGRNLMSYYSEGLLDGVLASIRPGDIVSLSAMGTNGMGSTFEKDLNYYIDAFLAMGAKVVLGSYTPHGAVSGYTSGYNSGTQTFDSYRRDSYDNIIRSTYERRKSELLGFVDIGKLSDAAFNKAVADAKAAASAEGKTESEILAAGEAKAQEIISCFSDHNHYSNGTLACKLILDAITPVMAEVALGGSQQPGFEIADAVLDGSVLNVSAKATALDGTVSFALYKDGELVKCGIADAMTDGVAVYGFDAAALEGEYVVKAFIWDDVNTMKPLFKADSKTISF